MPPIPPNNSEIDQALKEFEAKSNQEQAARGIITPQPSSVLPKEVEGVKFEIPSYGAVKYYEETDTPKMVKLVMKWSGSKEQKSAEWILLAFVIVAISISLYLFFGGSSPKLSSKNKEALDQMLQQHPELIKK